MRNWLQQIGLVALLWPCVTSAQLVSVRCCMLEKDLTGIGLCMTGPADTQTPLECHPPGTCVLGFGTDIRNMTALCHPDRPKIPDPDRGVCVSWDSASQLTTQECVATNDFDTGIEFLYEADGDGDIDLVDLAVYQRDFQLTPKIEQSPSRIVSVECCFPQGGLRGMGPCLSGPGAPLDPSACKSDPVCTIGFSQPVGPGDFLFNLCRTQSTEPSFASDPTCISWREDSATAVQYCQASSVDGIVSTFADLDVDADGDLDLMDVAEYQRAAGEIE